MVAYARGAIGRQNQTVAATPQPLGADPTDLPCGYYRVRSAEGWRVARWMPSRNRWEAGGGLAWPARHFDEIGERVA